MERKCLHFVGWTIAVIDMLFMILSVIKVIYDVFTDASSHVERTFYIIYVSGHVLNFIISGLLFYGIKTVRTFQFEKKN